MQGHKVRRQVDQLTAKDLDDYPVWEFAIDEEGGEGQDETTVRPTHAAASYQSTVIVRSAARLADGTSLTGLIVIPPGASPEDIQAGIVLDVGHIHFWCGAIPPSRGDIERSYALFGRRAAQVFPIQFTPTIQIGGVPEKIVVTAFQYLDGDDVISVT